MSLKVKTKSVPEAQLEGALTKWLSDVGDDNIVAINTYPSDGRVVVIIIYKSKDK